MPAGNLLGIGPGATRRSADRTFFRLGARAKGRREGLDGRLVAPPVSEGVPLHEHRAADQLLLRSETGDTTSGTMRGTLANVEAAAPELVKSSTS